MARSINQSLVRGLPAGKYLYRHGMIAFTSEYLDQIGYPHFLIQILNMKIGEVSDISIPLGKECLAEDWSPDASQLLVVCRKDGMNFEIGLIDIQNGKYTLLLQDLDEKGNSDGYESPQ